MNPEQAILWISGLFEGEGTISINKNGVRVAVEMTDYDVIKTLQDNCGGSIYAYEGRKSNHKKSWKWTLTSSKESCDFLNSILPYLHTRRTNRAKEAIDYYAESLKIQAEKDKKRKETLTKIKELAKSNLTHKEIAIKLHVSRSYVTYTLNGKYN